MAAVLPLPDERDRTLKPNKEAAAKIGTLPDIDFDVVENPDGTATVQDKKAIAKAEEGESQFDQNLCDLLTEAELDTLAHELLERIELDKESRAARDKQYADGLKRTGLSEEAPGGAQFTGASRAAHPMLAEAAVDFGASAMRELFPPSGPVRTKIIGSQTQEQLQVSDRQYKYMNWQLTEQMVEYAEELQQCLTQVPMGGTQGMKFYPDETQRRPVSEFVPIDDLLVPYGCNSFWAAHRITHVQRLTDIEFQERTDSGMYRELPNEDASSQVPDTTKTAEVVEKIEGAEAPMKNIDGLRIVYEANTFWALPEKADKGKRLPYLITICERTRKIAAIYRNWEEEDPRLERLHWIVDFNFIPWRGAIKLGLPQLIGGLSVAGTGALRALLDAGLVNTLPTLVKLKGPKTGGQSIVMNAGEMTEIDGGTTVDDIRKLLMPVPFNQPSPVLFQLLEWITNAAKSVVTTATEKIADASPNMPMGTALALIEQDAKLFSTIHASLHRSQARALKIIARINKDFLDEEEQVHVFGEIICTRDDFRQPLGVIPVSDPNIFSEGQRYAQMHLIQQTAATYPQLHNPYEMISRSYKLAKIPESDIDAILPKPKTPQELNAAAENAAVMLGEPLMAFPEQEHYAHLETHMRFVIDPLLGGSPAAVSKAYKPMLEHIKQHLAFLYAKEMHDLVSETMGIDLGEFIKDRKNWPEADRVLAAASRLVHNKLQQVVAPLGPVIQKMVQQVAAMEPPAPMDPSAAAVKVAAMEDERQRMEAAQKTQLDAQKADASAAHMQNQDAAKARELELKDKDISLSHGVAADKVELEASRHEHDQNRAAIDDQHRIADRDQDAHHEAESRLAASIDAARGAEGTAQQQMHKGGLADADRAHRGAEAAAERRAAAAEAERSRAHQAAESDASRRHEAAQAEAARQSAERTALAKAKNKPPAKPKKKG